MKEKYSNYFKWCVTAHNMKDIEKIKLLDKLINIKDAETAYFLGFLWGDGYIGDRTFGIHNIAKDVLKILPIFNKITSIWKTAVRKTKHQNWQDSINVRISDTRICNLLSNYGYREKSKISPSIILSNIDSSLHPFWWRGYFDADGCITMNIKNGQGKRFTISSTYDQDWSCLENLLTNLEIKFSIKSRITKKNHKSSCVRSTGRENIFKFFNYIYNDKLSLFGLPRKYNKFIEVLTFVGPKCVTKKNKQYAQFSYKSLEHN